MKTIADHPPTLEPLNQQAELTTTAIQRPAPATSGRRLSPSETPNALPWDQVPLKDSPRAQDELTRLLYQTFASQKTYGDKAEMMEYRDGMFQMILAEFPFHRIKAALLEHVRRKPDLPTPSDIYNLLDPPKEPLSSAVYVGLKQRIQEGYYPLSAEREFLRAFEQQELRRAKA